MQNLLSALFSPRLLRPLFWLLVVFSLTMALLPHPPRLFLYKFSDKFEHMLAFSVLTLVARLAWPRARVWTLMIMLSLYGAMIEVLQANPALHRDADPRDWVVDSVAIAIAALFAQFLIYFRTDRDTI